MQDLERKMLLSDFRKSGAAVDLPALSLSSMKRRCCNGATGFPDCRDSESDGQARGLLVGLRILKTRCPAAQTANPEWHGPEPPHRRRVVTVAGATSRSAQASTAAHGAFRV